MSSLTSAPSVRPFAAAGFLVAALLAVPAAAHGQAGPADRALLNRIPVPAARVTVFRHALPVSGGEAPVSGERALLGRVPPSNRRPAIPETGSGEPPAAVSGERALLGRTR